MTTKNEKERKAVDINGIVLFPGDSVVVINDETGGDTDHPDTWDLTKGKSFVVDTIYDDDNLLSPMITLKESSAGPVFAERFTLQARAKCSPLTAVLIGYCENTETETIVASFTKKQVDDNVHDEYLEQAQKYNTDAALSFRLSFLS